MRHAARLTCLAALILTACGGGGSPEPEAATDAAPVAAAPAAALAEQAAAADDAPAAVALAVEPEWPVAPPDTTAVAAPLGEWLTRFDGAEALALRSDGQAADLVGIVPPVAPASEWPFALDPGRLAVQFQGGDSSERWARLVADEVQPANQVLRFALRSANVRDDAGQALKGRVQMNAYDVDAMRAREIRFSARMYLHPSFGWLTSLPQSFGWLTISEWWNNAGWTGEPYPFRITVDLTKPAAAPGSPLRFAVRAETLNTATRQWDTTVWKVTNREAEVPVGRWVTLEYHYREGDAADGRFYLAMVAEGGPRQVLFDVRDWTRHPADPAPDGLTHLNPLKLYTSKALIDAVRNAGGVLAVDWDDLAFRVCPAAYAPSASPCRPETFR